MPDWARELIAWLLAPTGVVALSVGWYFKAWREDRIKREATQQAIVDRLEERNEALRAKIESLLMDAYARERENNALRTERLAMDKQLAALATAMTAALERSRAKDGQ